MAAVLCKGIGDCIGGVCNCVGTIITVPCRLCGATCEAVSELCQKSPFAIQVAVTVCLQGPAMVIAMLAILDGSGTSCSGGGSSSNNSQAVLWLILAIVFGIIHIVAAIYLAVRVVNRDDPELEHMNTAIRRAQHLLCQDHWMALYIILLIGYVVFLGVGSSWLWSGGFDVDNNTDDDCIVNSNDSMQGKVQMVLGLGWFFLIFGAMSLCTGLCCACCDKEDYGGTSGAANNFNNNDVESPNTPRPPPPSAPYGSTNTTTNSGKSSGTHQKPPPTAPSYTSQGIPINNPGQEPEIPVAYAEAVPTSSHASAPPAEDEAYAKASAQYNATQQQQQQSKPSSSTSTAAADSKAGSWGMTMGQQVGKLFYKDDSRKQQELQKKGKQTGEAVGKGFLSAKTFVQSKLHKSNNTSNNNN